MTRMQILKRIRLSALFVAAAVCCVPIALAQAAQSADDEALKEGWDQMVARLSDVTTQRQRAARIAEVALIERPEGPLGTVALELLDRELAPESVLQNVFRRGDSFARIKILDMYLNNWDVLGQGTATSRGEMVRGGVTDDDPDVRRAAAQLAAQRPIHQSGHFMIDAAIADSRLTQAAIFSLGVNRDFRPVRWAVAHLNHDDARLAQSARYAIWRIGPKARFALVERIDDDDPDTRAAMIEALLGIASDQDTQILYRWLENDGPNFPELSERVSQALSSLEVGAFRPQRPAPPALEFK